MSNRPSGQATRRGLPATEKGFRPQLHYIAMATTWIVTLGTVLLYGLLANFNVWCPDARWWMVTAATILLIAMAGGCLVVRRFQRGTHQGWATAVLMLSVAPLVGLGCFAWDHISRTDQQQNLRSGMVTNALTVWRSSWLEIRAHWRYDRQTRGRHVILFDQGIADGPNRLVSRMDSHVDSLLGLLGDPDHRNMIRWVRGSLSGMTTRAFGLWAISDADNQSDVPLPLDKYIVAQSVISSLCDVRSDPPRLLAEGWASATSEAKATVVARLQDKHTRGVTYALGELVAADFYGRSVQPNYHHGGPLVLFLIERFGGQKFLELYRTARRETFPADAKRALGISWQQVDNEFWTWLGQQDIGLQKNDRDQVRQKAPGYIFQDPDCRQRWQTIVDEVKRYETRFDGQLPKQFAISVINENQDTKFRSTLNVLFDPNETSLTFETNQDQAGTSYIRWSKRRPGFHCQRGPDASQDVTLSDLDRDDPLVLDSVQRARAALHMASLRNQLPIDLLDPQLPSGQALFNVNEITPGPSPADPWVVDLSERSVGQSAKKYRFWLDPGHGFQVLRWLVTSADETTRYTMEFDDILGNRVCAAVTSGESVKRLSLMNRQQANQFTRAFEQLEIELDRQNTRSLFRPIVNPTTVAYGWIVMAFLILGIELVTDRVKIRVKAN